MTLERDYNRSVRILTLFVLLMLPLFSIGKDGLNTLFEQGNKQYTEAKYADAVRSYQKILDAGYESAEVHFNLGNTFYKSGNLPAALLNYEKAYRLAPGDKDIQHNIQFANARTTDKIESVPDFFLQRWWRNLFLFFSIKTFSILSITLITLGFWSLILFRFAQLSSIKRAAFYIGIGLIFLGVVTIFMAITQHNYFQQHRQAIVFQTTVTVKSEPVNVSKDLFVIHAGTKITILAKDSGWIKLELSNGKVGWVPAGTIKQI
ncbi:MAG: tetratricopeptide repeat protein [Sphingobacteriaceae bacterium]